MGCLVLALMSFHVYITAIGFTTQEKLKHMYDRFNGSPFAMKSCFSEFFKYVVCPQKVPSRISHELILKTNAKEEFDEILKLKGQANMPRDLFEHSYEIFEP
jgi:hypothetical protein